MKLVFYLTYTMMHRNTKVKFLWTNYQTVAETSDNTEHPQETDIHASDGIRTRNLSK